MTYRAALAVLAGRRETVIRLGLGPVRRVLAALGNPQESFSSIHVAGTNGKGSVCAILARALQEAGHKTGFYLSPHLWSVQERIQVSGRMIAPAAFGRLMGETLSAEKRTRERLTYFELVTCVAFLYFREQGARAAVLETGLGGRLDATNVVRRPAACVISSIGLDHTEFLGPTLRHIAREKSGIIKRGRPVFCPKLAPEALAVVRRKAASLRAPLRVVARPWSVTRVHWRKNRQVLKDSAGRVSTLGILGARQAMNAAVARAVVKGIQGELPVSEAAWRRGLALARWPLRFDVRAAGRGTVILDGAHNPEAAKCLAQTWAASPWRRQDALWIFGLMREKDARGVAAALAPHWRSVVVCPPPSPRAMEPEILAGIVRAAAPRANISVAPSAVAALRAWRADSRGPSVAVVCGSFYLAAQAARALDRTRGSAAR